MFAALNRDEDHVMLLLLEMFFKMRTPAYGREGRKKANVKGDGERETEMVGGSHYLFVQNREAF